MNGVPKGMFDDDKWAKPIKSATEAWTNDKWIAKLVEYGGENMFAE